MGTFKDYHESLNKRLKYLYKLLQDFKLKRLAMINKGRAFFWYNSRDLMYIISPVMSQLHTASRKVMIKYVGPCFDCQRQAFKLSELFIRSEDNKTTMPLYGLLS